MKRLVFVMFGLAVGLAQNTIAPNAIRPYQILDGGLSFNSENSSDSASPSIGYTRIRLTSGRSTPAGIAVFGLRQNNVLVTEAAVPAAPSITSGRIFAEINGFVDTGLAIANPNPTDVTISFF